MKTKISVRDAMTSRVIFISPSTSLEKVAKLMIKHDIGGIVVVDKNKPIGIVTEKDFTTAMAAGKKLHKLKAKQAMSSPLITVSPEASILAAAKIMTKSKVRKLPVKSHGKLVGILTAEDIVKVAPREIELLLELASIKFQEMSEEESERSAESATEGDCETCGNYSSYLYRIEGGSYVCGDCRESEEEKDE